MSETYSVVFAGELKDGFELDSVKRAFIEVFKLNQENVQKYFSGQPRVVKKNLDINTATKYQKAFAKVGANVTVLDNVKAAQLKKQAKLKQSTPTLPTESLKPKTETAAREIQGQQPSEPRKSKEAVAEEMMQRMQAPAASGTNLIERGRRRQNEKMSRIQLADESRSRVLLLSGLGILALSTIDFILYYLGIDLMTGQLWPSVAGALLGAVMLKSSSIN